MRARIKPLDWEDRGDECHALTAMGEVWVAETEDGNFHVIIESRIVTETDTLVKAKDFVQSRHAEHVRDWLREDES